MMNVLAISDLHEFLPEIPACDLLLLGGDYNNKRDREMQLRFMNGPFREWLKGIPARHIVGIAGNHDFVLEEWPDLLKDLPWTYLKDELVEIEGVRIYGTPWTPTFGNWAFQKDDWKLKTVFHDIPDGLDILLSHGPTYMCLDKVIEGDRCGSRALMDKVYLTCPDSVVHGHIHDAHGIVDNGATRFYNVSHVNRELEPVNGPVYIPLRIG